MICKFRSIIGEKLIHGMTKCSLGDHGMTASDCIHHIKVLDKKSEFHVGVDIQNILRQKTGKFTERDNVRKIASTLTGVLSEDDTLEKIGIEETKDKTVYLGFKINGKKLANYVIPKVLDDPGGFWRSSCLLSMPTRTVLVDFSSPNIAKPFHMGHLRSTIIGNFVSNINTALGHNVTKINYLGDWGTQFGLLKYGYDAKKLDQSDLEEEAIKKLYDIYVWANKQAETDPTVIDAAKEIFKQMENKNKEQLDTWRFFRQISIKELEKVYSRLNIKFDEYHGESFYTANNIKDILALMEAKNLLKIMEDGRKIYEVRPGHVETLVKSDGTCLYLTRDIAAAVDRYQTYCFDDMYYVVDGSQTNYFQILINIIEKLGFDWWKGMNHIRFGRIKNMSTRKGTAIFLNDILDEARSLTIEKMNQSINDKRPKMISQEKNADIVGSTNIIAGDLTKKRNIDYEFDWEAIFKSESAGIKLQYSHCRLGNLLKNCEIDINHNADMSCLGDDSVAMKLILHISKFDETLLQSYNTMEPCILTKYLFNLRKLSGHAYKIRHVKAAPVEVAEARLLMFMAARYTLGAGMRILGLQPLDEM